MKIVVVGGKARSIMRHRGPLVRAMVQAGHDVVCTAPDNELAMADQIPTVLGARFEPVALRRSSTNPLVDARGVAELAALMRRESPDLVFSYTIKPVIYGSIAARIAGVPQITSLITGLGAGFIATNARQRARRRVVTSLYQAALAVNHRIAFQNSDDAALFLELGILPDLSRVEVVDGSGIDLDHFARQPLPPGPLKVLWLGRLLNDKGLIELVDAMRLLRELCPQVQLSVLGLFDDAQPARLSREQVQGWHDDGLITFLGGTDDVRPYIAEAHVVALPSYREGIPRSLLEAMAIGRAILTTDAPGCRHTVRDGVEGFVVPVGNPKAIADAIARFDADPALVERMADAAHARARDTFAVDRINAAMFSAIGLTD